ncbi:DUF2860 domain-containing protein [Aliagarivorans marinus]|uniref:DUF2860 domain-containing protein n=1 Tax=Aliagarivorans marinus TaxID=561965 RepID=UPI0003FB2272|nr:DUF2860 domain-containing protein [Aliagarivorans marinus]
MRKLLVCTAIGTLLASHASAAAPLAKEPGWSTTLNLNVGFASSESQFNTDSDNAITDDLNNSGKKQDSFLGYPLLRVEYTTENLKNQWFLGNSPENVGRGQLQYELGYTRAMGERSQLTAAYFPRLKLFSETWQDPFVVGEKRHKTDESVQGLRVEWKAIAESPFSAEYVFAQRKIDDEHSGESRAGINTALLRREADIHRLDLGVSFPLSQRLFMSPSFVYTRVNADGDAMSNDDYMLRINTVYRQQQHLLNLNLEWGQRKFDEANPVFNRTQKDDHYSLFALYVYQEPFGWSNSMFNVTAGFSRNNANITFYDSSGTFAALGMGYRF